MLSWDLFRPRVHGLYIARYRIYWWMPWIWFNISERYEWIVIATAVSLQARSESS